MQIPWPNIISGLVGALVGGAMSIYGVYRNEVRRRRGDLLKILVRQAVLLRTMETKSLANLPRDEHLAATQAYIDLRSVLMLPWERQALDQAWRVYKGSDDPFVPLFQTYTSRRLSPTCIEGTSHTPTWEESRIRIAALIAHLCGDEEWANQALQTTPRTRSEI